MERVLLIGLEFVEPLFSGNGVLTHSVVRGLLQIGYDVTVLCARPEGTAHQVNASMSKYEKLHVISVPVPDSTWRRLDIKSAWKELAANVSEISELSHETFRYVFGVDWSAIPTYRAIQSKLSGQPHLILLVFRVFSRSRELLTSDEESTFYQTRERDAIDIAAATFVLSHVDREELITLCDNASQKFHVLVPPLRQDMYDICAASPDLRHSGERKYLICNVRLSPEKNAIQFAHIVAVLEKNGTLKKAGLVPVMIGTICDPQYAAEVQAILPETTIIVDTFLSTHKMLEYLHQAALLVHPPVYDAYGMTIAEAAAVSTPAIIHENHIGASSLFRVEQDEIFTADFTTVETAVAKLTEILDSPDTLKRIGENAHRRTLSWTTSEYAQQLDLQLKALS